MKVGLLAYSTNTGLGNQTYEFYRHMKPSKTLIADLRRFNGMKTNHSLFEGAKIANGIPNCDEMDWLTQDVDVVFVAETPLNFCLFQKAKEKGVATIQQYNYEFLNFFKQPDKPKPTVLAAPTEWNIDKIKNLQAAKVVNWPVPINRQILPFREITKLQTIIHVIGRPAVHDRNGTLTFLDAIKKIGNRFKYKVFYQEPSDQRAIQYFKPVKENLNRARQNLNIEVITDVPKYQDIYKGGDLLVMPRRYGGLCLPMNEALSVGMPVIMSDISPNGQWLPKEWLIPAKFKQKFFAHVDVDVYEADANLLAFRILEFADSTKIQDANKKADEIAERLSWQNLLPEYEKLMTEAIQSTR